MKISGRAIILRDKRFIALVKRVRGDRTYYIYPGATMEENGDPAEAVQKGCKFYLGSSVKVGDVIAEISYKDEKHIYHLAEYSSGEFGSGPASKRDIKGDKNIGQTSAAWIPLNEINTVQVFPIVITDLVKKFREKREWPPTVQRFEDIGVFIDHEFE